MSTWGLSGTSPLADFAVDPEDLIYRYLGDNWAITTPAHINKATLFQTTDPAQMINRPDPGNRQIWLWVQHADLDSARTQLGSGLGRSGPIGYLHTFNIHLMTTRLTQGLTFPDLGILGRELQRLIYQYNNQISGLQHFNSFRMFPYVEATALGPAWASFSGTYIATCQAVAQYQKESTV